MRTAGVKVEFVCALRQSQKKSQAEFISGRSGSIPPQLVRSNVGTKLLPACQRQLSPS
jgi:hypothetical protein